MKRNTHDVNTLQRTQTTAIRTTFFYIKLVKFGVPFPISLSHPNSSTRLSICPYFIPAALPQLFSPLHNPLFNCHGLSHLEVHQHSL